MSLAAAPQRAPGRADEATVSGVQMVRETVAIAATLCGTVPALMPLLDRGMAATHDGFLHVQRLIAIEAAIRGGAPLTRWLPDLAYGYGQPLLLYYAPISYLPALAARFAGAGFVTSFEIASGLALVLSALAMYAFLRSLAGPLAACVGALVYSLLPYQLVDLYVRGALAETWAFVWLPLCALCLTRAWTSPHASWSGGVAVSVAALVLTHNVTALFFLPALALLGLLLQVGTSRSLRTVPLRPLLGLALGLILSAWFWLPALAERGLVQIGETIEPDLFASFFVRAWPPFRLDPLYDYERPVSTALGSPIFWPQLGLIQVAVTIFGIIAVGRSTGALRVVAVWAVVLAVAGYVLQFRPLAPLFDMIPLLSFIQFPWRLLALIGFGSAILAAVTVEAMSARTTIRGTFALLIVGASLVTAIARLDPEMSPVDERTLSTESITRIELADYGLGTTHSGEYLPVSSGQRNAARFRKTVIDADAGRAAGESPPATTVQVERVDWLPAQIRVQFTAAAPERIVLHQFAFPGWAATVDGVAVAMHTTGALGLLGADVPPGRHMLEVTWSWSQIRIAAAAVSLIGLALLALLAASVQWRPAQALGIGLVVVALVGAVILVPWRLAPDSLDTPERLIAPPTRVSESLTLVGGAVDQSRILTDRLVIAQTLWHVRQTPAAGYRAHLALTAENGQQAAAAWAYEPLSRVWEQGEIVPATVSLRIPPDFPAGEAQLHLVFERPGGLTPLPLGTVQVPNASAIAAGPPPSDGIDVGAGLHVSVLASSEAGAEARLRVRLGGTLDIPLRWQMAAALPNADRELVTVAVLTAPGGEVVSDSKRPGDWFAPLPFWQQGETVEQNVRLSIPRWVPRGSYPLVIRIYSRDLARFGISEPGTSSARPRGRPLAELAVGNVTVER